MEQVWVKYRA